MIKTLPSNAEGVGSIPAQGTKAPHVPGYSQNFLKQINDKIYSLPLMIPFVKRTKWTRPTAERSREDRHAEQGWFRHGERGS